MWELNKISTINKFNHKMQALTRSHMIYYIINRMINFQKIQNLFETWRRYI